MPIQCRGRASSGVDLFTQLVPPQVSTTIPALTTSSSPKKRCLLKLLSQVIHLQSPVLELHSELLRSDASQPVSTDAVSRANAVVSEGGRDEGVHAMFGDERGSIQHVIQNDVLLSITTTYRIII